MSDSIIKGRSVKRSYKHGSKFPITIIISLSRSLFCLFSHLFSVLSWNGVYAPHKPDTRDDNKPTKIKLHNNLILLVGSLLHNIPFINKKILSLASFLRFSLNFYLCSSLTNRARCNSSIFVLLWWFLLSAQLLCHFAQFFIFLSFFSLLLFNFSSSF